jgi:YfiH family protein
MTELAPLQSTLLAALPGVRHAFFTRQGGISEGLYRSLNVGPGSRDDPAAVEENRARAAAWFGAPPTALVTAYQIHSSIAQVATGPWSPQPEGDAVVSTTPGLVCGALAADCAPILIADTGAGVIAAVHAGWRGALGGVIASAVEAMTRLGADPARMVAAVGPCIGPKSYEVGLDFLEAFVREDPGFTRFFSAGASPEKRQFDLPAFVLHRLIQSGVVHAEWIGHDTCADGDLFFSNRRAFKDGEPDYGRLLSAIMLEG